MLTIIETVLSQIKNYKKKTKQTNNIVKKVQVLHLKALLKKGEVIRAWPISDRQTVLNLRESDFSYNLAPAQYHNLQVVFRLDKSNTLAPLVKIIVS